MCSACADGAELSIACIVSSMRSVYSLYTGCSLLESAVDAVSVCAVCNLSSVHCAICAAFFTLQSVQFLVCAVYSL